MHAARLLPHVLCLIGTACSNNPDGNLHIVVPDLDKRAVGETTLIIGPDGRIVLLDTANDRHAAEVRALVRQHTGATRVDDLIVTSYSAAHVGGVDDLLSPASEDMLDVRRVITRGPFDLDEDADVGEYRDICEPVEASGVDRLDLCSSDDAPACEGNAGPVRASGCPGLTLGDLDDSGDDLGEDEAGAASFLDLGEGARLNFVHADGYTAAGPLGAVASSEADTPGLVEGGRSLVVSVTWGEFSYLRGGDIGGNPADGPDVESALAVEGLVPAVDILQLNRHGSTEASNDTWLDAVLAGEQTKDAIVSGAAAFEGYPAADVVARVATHLNGGAIWATSTENGFEGDGVTLCSQADQTQDLTVIVAPGGSYSIACVDRQDDGR